MVSVTSSTFDSDLLFVRITPTANPAFASLRKHMGFLLDTSGSMNEYGRLTSVKKTLDLLIRAKPENYSLTVVSFASDAAIVAEAEQDPATLHSALAALTPNGGTNLEAGLLLLRTIDQRNPLDAVVLLTDGEVTVGTVRTTAGLTSLVRSSFPTRIPVHTIGCGESYNRALLTTIAKLTHSLHMYADAAETLPAIAGDLLAGLQSEIGTRAVLLFPPSYVCEEATEEAREGETTIGTLIAEKEQWVLLRKVADAPPGPCILRYKGSDGEDVSHTIPLTSDLPRLQMAVQRDRVLSTKAMARIYELIETGRTADALLACRETLAALEASEATGESLLLSLKAQFAELVDQLTPAARHPGLPDFLGLGAAAPPPPGLLSRLASNTSALATQRGFVTRMTSGGSDTHTFSSPSQRVAQRSMTQSYSESP
jgi:hypothetical protein